MSLKSKTSQESVVLISSAEQYMSELSTGGMSDMQITGKQPMDTREKLLYEKKVGKDVVIEYEQQYSDDMDTKHTEPETISLDTQQHSKHASVEWFIDNTFLLNMRDNAKLNITKIENVMREGKIASLLYEMMFRSQRQHRRQEVLYRKHMGLINNFTIQQKTEHYHYNVLRKHKNGLWSALAATVMGLLGVGATVLYFHVFA